MSTAMSTPANPAIPTGGVAFAPLLRFFLRSRMTRSQYVVTFIYIVTIVFLTFFSERYAVEPELRLAWYVFFMPFFWPAWLVDDELNPRGAMRLFVVPRHSLRPVMLAYIAARNIYAVAVATFSILVVYNIDIAEAQSEMFIPLSVFTFSACLVYVNAAMFLGMFLRGRLMLVLLYVFVIGLSKIQSRWDDPVRSAIGALIGPMWAFSYTWMDVLEYDPWQIIFVFTSAAFWASMGWLLFKRKFR